MRPSILRRKRPLRLGAASVEFALFVPLLAFLFVVGIDFARVFYFSLTLKNCARNGAYFASDYPGLYGYTTATDTALADGSNLNPPLTASNVTIGYDSSSTGTFSQTTPVRPGYVKVTVTWTYTTVTNYPGVPSTWNLSQSEIMEMGPITPSNFPP
jgi:Flp pilus assembly protein TadG